MLVYASPALARPMCQCRGWSEQPFHKINVGYMYLMNYKVYTDVGIGFLSMIIWGMSDNDIQ